MESCYSTYDDTGQVTASEPVTKSTKDSDSMHLNRKKIVNTGKSGCILCFNENTN